MIIIASLFLIIFINKSLNEIPKSTCPIGKPFKTKDNECMDFYEICVKKNDMECNNFQTACKQCPPSNYSVMMFIDLINVKNELIETKNRLEALKIQSNIYQNKTSKSMVKQNHQIAQIFMLLWIIIFIIIICLVLIIIEVRFKLLTKIFRKHQNSSYKYEILKSRKFNFWQDSFKRNEEATENKLKEVIEKMEDWLSRCQSMFNCDDDLKYMQVQFELDEKIFKMRVDENDTAVKIKRDICQKLSVRNSDNFKRMTMTYKEAVIEDNKYLFKTVGMGNNIIKCKFDKKINPMDFVVLNILFKDQPFVLIMIRKSETFTVLKETINQLSKDKCDLLILKDNLQMEDSRTDGALDFVDDTCLRVIENKKNSLIISNIFDEVTKVRVDYFPSHSVELVTKHLADTFNADPDRFVLFLGNHSLNEKEFMWQYGITNEQSVNYCCLQRLNGVDIGDSLYKGKISELIKATDKTTKIEMLLLKYDVIAENKLQNNEHIVKELRTFQIIKSNERFVKLLNLYHRDQHVYVALENMSEGTLKMFLKKNEPIEINLVLYWSMKILQGLEYLHKNGIILRDLNPSNILVDQNEDIKLYGFNLSKYRDSFSPSSFYNSDDYSGLSVRYFAPELIGKKDYDEKCDVWSFGMVLVKIITKVKPFPNLSKDTLVQMMKADPFPYKYPIESDEFPLKGIIDKCLQRPEKRPSANILKQKIRKNYY